MAQNGPEDSLHNDSPIYIKVYKNIDYKYVNFNNSCVFLYFRK